MSDVAAMVEAALAEMGWGGSHARETRCVCGDERPCIAIDVIVPQAIAWQACSLIAHTHDMHPLCCWSCALTYDSLPRDKRVVVPNVMNGLLAEMLERRGFMRGREWAEGFEEWVEIHERVPA